MNLGQVEQLHALRRRAQARARPDGDATIQLAAFRLIVKLYIEKMPIGLAFVGENKKRVRMFAQQLRYHRALQGAREIFGREPAINDMESPAVTAAREQHWIIPQTLPRRFRPAAS